MNSYITQFKYFWRAHFLTQPNNLKALRITLSAFLSLIIFYLLGIPKSGLLVGMGIVAAALTESDIHYKSAIKSTFVITILFFLFSSLTRVLSPHPIPFGIFLVAATFILTVAGGYKEKYASLAFGTILIIIYTLILNIGQSEWYEVPLLFSFGVIVYMVTTIINYKLNLFQNLQSEIALGYRMLGKYLNTKAKFFPSTSAEQEDIRNELALINIELFSQTEKIKSLLLRYDRLITKSQREDLKKYIQEWNKLQILHERAVSSHEPYDLISKNNQNPMLIAGFGKVLNEIGKAAEIYATSILRNISYESPASLVWSNNALKNLINQQHNKKEYLDYLFKNITSIGESLNANKPISTSILKSNSSPTSAKELFSVHNARFRHAVRISFCFLAGYALMILFNIELGAWILLTSLIVCQQTYDATRQRFFKRIIGTLLGVIIGIILAYLVPTVAGQTVILLVSMYIFFKYISKNYIIAAIFITIYVLEVYNLQNGSGVAVMLPRIIDTLIGSVLAYLSIRFIWPEWQYKNLKPLLIKAIEKNKRYFESVMNSNISEADYLHNHRSAHRADNSLTQVWKGMRIEPQSKRKLLTSARNFTYLNHSLLSYISALGAHRHNLNFTNDDFIQRDEIIDILNEVKRTIQNEQCIESATYINIFKALKNTKDANGNALFLKNIQNVSNELKEAACALAF